TRSQIQDEATLAFRKVIRLQTAVATENNPAIHFRNLVRTLVATQRGHFLSINGDVPQNASTLGWRFDGTGTNGRWVPGGSAIGWADGGDLFLDPSGSYAAAQRLATEQHEPLAITAAEAPWSVGNARTNDIRSEMVLWLDRQTLTPSDAHERKECAEG